MFRELKIETRETYPREASPENDHHVLQSCVLYREQRPEQDNGPETLLQGPDKRQDHGVLRKLKA